ncbi:MAG: HNH endonuclease signature motif containing protein [Trueperaceae bacterium]|nr:HNH endonuclease signature motif containing protein [Trueperaceae bacterium]
MAINQKDIKLLWGRSGNRCSICRKELTQDSRAVDASFTLGEMAHIVGEKENAPRGTSILSPEERNSYHNLVLLCPTDHSLIDKNVEDYPVEKLHQIKSEHELWVRETLGGSGDLRVQAESLAVTQIIDATVEDCRLSTWKEWSGWAVSSEPRWEVDFAHRLPGHHEKVATVVWPKEFEELKNATFTLSLLLYRALQILTRHSKREDGYFQAVRFYRNSIDSESYTANVEFYKNWINQYYDSVIEATKAANWFADTVRRDVNPLFFVEHGKFGLPRDVLENDFRYSFTTPEFSEDEKQSLPDSLRNDT